MLNDCLVNLLGNLFNGSRIYSFFLLILFFIQHLLSALFTNQYALMRCLKHNDTQLYT